MLAQVVVFFISTRGYEHVSARESVEGPDVAVADRAGARPRRARAPRTRFLPRVDLMEDRTLLSTLTVINTNDSGAGSLRAAITAAASGDTINFAHSLIGLTIRLTSGELTIAKSLNIDGLGTSQLTVSGGSTSRVFDIASGADVTLSGLTIANGVAVQGGGIDNFGTLTVDRCTLLNNKAVGGGGNSTTPDAANGGGIANEVGASLTLTRSLLANNVAAASPGDDSFGDALLNWRRHHRLLHLHEQPGYRRRQFELLRWQLWRSHRKFRLRAEPALWLDADGVQQHIHGQRGNRRLRLHLRRCRCHRR